MTEQHERQQAASAPGPHPIRRLRRSRRRRQEDELRRRFEWAEEARNAPTLATLNERITRPARPA